MLKTIFLTLALTFSFTVVAGPQQNKMKQCNVDAKGKSGAERKAFMKECLSAKVATAPTAEASPQQRMKDCNAKATGMKGEARKTFMSSCLSGK